MLLYVHRDRTDYKGLGALDGHFDFHTASELCLKMALIAAHFNAESFSWLLKCCFTSTEMTVGLLGTGAQDVHLDFHTAPVL